MPIEDKEAFDRSIFAHEAHYAPYAKILGMLIALMETYGNPIDKKVAVAIDRMAQSGKIPE